MKKCTAFCSRLHEHLRWEEELIRPCTQIAFLCMRSGCGRETKLKFRVECLVGGFLHHHMDMHTRPAVAKWNGGEKKNINKPKNEIKHNIPIAILHKCMPSRVENRLQLGHGERTERRTKRVCMWLQLRNVKSSRYVRDQGGEESNDGRIESNVHDATVDWLLECLRFIDIWLKLFLALVHTRTLPTPVTCYL